MKRIIAALLACTMITGAFVSCGSSSGGDSESTADTGEKASYCGKWEWGTNQYFNISSDGTIKLEGTTSGTSMMTFNNDGTGTISGVEYGPGQFDFDGETYRLHFDSDNDMTLKRIEPNDGTEFFGLYKMISGVAYDSIEQGYNNRAAEKGSIESFNKESADIQLDISEGKTDIIILYTIGEILSDDTLKISISGESFGGTYSVDGDIMTITSDAGKTKELKRVM